MTEHIYGEPETITGPHGDSLETQTMSVNTIAAQPGYTLLRMYSDTNSLYELPIIAWQVQVMRRVEKHCSKVKDKNVRFRETSYYSSVTPVTVEGTTGDNEDWAIELPSGQVEIPDVESFANRAALLENWVKEKVKTNGT